MSLPSALIRQSLRFLLAMAFLALTNPASAQEGQNVTDIKLVGPEKLGYFAQKVRDHQPVTIACLGGSITVGAGASAYPNNYFWKSWLALQDEIKKRGDSAKPINAGIGGTGSIYGAFRVGAQVLSQNPDLLVVEFAVNDCPKDQAHALAQKAGMIDGMESIVRQALEQNPKMGIVFLYTSAACFQDDFYSKSLVTASVAAHHEVALHYGITEALAGPSIADGIRDGKFTDATFFTDGTHPSDIGHALYAKVLTEAILPGFDQPAPASPKPLPPLLGSGKYENARLTPIAPTGATEGWSSPAKSPWNWPNVAIWTCDTAGKPLSFPVSGQSVQLICMGQLDVQWTSNGQKQHKLVTGTVGMPMPGSWSLPPDAAKPDDGRLTVEAVPAANGKVHGEVWGTYSILDKK